MPSADAVILPDNVRPVHYDLTLTPNFDDFTFDGEVDITVQMQPGRRKSSLTAPKLTSSRLRSAGRTRMASIPRKRTALPTTPTPRLPPSASPAPRPTV